MNDRSRSILLFCEEMARVNLLTVDEERAIAVRAQNGDEAAANELVTANLRYVVGVARRYRNQGTLYEDIVQQGNLGLMRAAQTYDVTHGARFLTYASRWVHQSIAAFLERDRGPLRMPLHAESRAALTAYRRDRPGTVAELAVLANLTESQAEYLWPAMTSVGSATDPEYLPARATDDVADRNEADVLKHEMSLAMTSLDQRERDIIERHILAEDSVSCPKLAAEYGVSRERVHQILRSGLAKIRNALADRGLCSMEDLCYPG